MSLPSIVPFIDELSKLGFVSDEHAQRALNRLDTLEKSKPTAGQVGRYAAIGAVAAPAISAIGNVVKGESPFAGNSLKQKLRDAAASAVKGGIGASAIPLARNHFDRRAEIGTLKGYLADRGEKTAWARTFDALEKWAALTPEQQAQYGTMRRNHAGLVQQASQKGSSPELNEQIRHSTERLKHYGAVSRGDIPEVAGWASDLKAAVPDSVLNPPPMKPLGAFNPLDATHVAWAEHNGAQTAEEVAEAAAHAAHGTPHVVPHGTPHAGALHPPAFGMGGRKALRIVGAGALAGAGLYAAHGLYKGYRGRQQAQAGQVQA